MGGPDSGTPGGLHLPNDRGRCLPALAGAPVPAGRGLLRDDVFQPTGVHPPSPWGSAGRSGGRPPYNLEPRKNLAALVSAFAQALPAAPAARLVLYGRAAVTPEREVEFDRTVAALGVRQAIVRTGFLTDDQLGWLYRRATIFAFPSLYEGFGYPVLEAMAAGACVVARGASAMAEVMDEAGVAVETASTTCWPGRSSAYSGTTTVEQPSAAWPGTEPRCFPSGGW